MRACRRGGSARSVYVLWGGSVRVGTTRTSTIGSFDGGGETEEKN